jgi:glycyl-tRNA synthetase beta chain
MLERARGYFTERGCRPDVIESVLVTRPAQPRELARRIAAVEAFRLLPEAIALAAANKRIGNILRKASDFTPDKVDLSALLEPAELALAQELAEASQQTTAFAAAGEYQAYLGRLARLQPAINAFFDQVMVMAEDLPLRNARLQLLHQLQALFLRVADIGLIAS